MAEALYASNISISNIFHSGKLRALQTANIITSTLAISSTSVTDSLSPYDDVTILAQKLNTNYALYQPPTTSGESGGLPFHRQ